MGICRQNLNRAGDERDTVDVIYVRTDIAILNSVARRKLARE